MKSITIGADFEVFIFKDSKLVDMDLIIPNNGKHNPINYYGYNITYDRKSLECGIPPFIFNPNIKLQLFNHIKLALDSLYIFIKGLDTNYKIVLKDWTYTKEYTWSKGGENNIYSGVEQSKKIKNNIITNGFHIHFSGIENHKPFIKSLDKSIGFYSKIMTPFTKRFDYGSLGSFKEKQYDVFNKGFEYRVLGGSMLRNFHLKNISILLNKQLNKI